MKKTRKKKSNALAKLHGALAGLLREHPQSAEAVADILKWIEEVENERHRGVSANPLAKLGPRGTSRGEAIKGYKIEKAGNGEEMLVERRYDNAKDFRCGHEIYMATAQTMATAVTGGMGFTEIMDGIIKHLGWQPPEYLPRMCLRFWLFGKERILIRSRARYEPMNPGKFVDKANHVWGNLADIAKK